MSKYAAMPRCVGSYEEKHAICDGQPGRGPCPSRDTCVSLQKHCKKNRTRPSDYVRIVKDSKGATYASPLGMDRFVKIMTNSMSQNIVVNGKVTEIPILATNPKSVQGIKRKKSAHTEKAKQLNVWFGQWVSIIAGRINMKLSPSLAEARPGDLFIRDRRETRGEIVLQIRGPFRKPGHAYWKSPRDFTIAGLKWRYNEIKFDIHWPLSPGEFDGISADRMRYIKPKAWKDNFFKTPPVFASITRSVDKPTLMLSAEIAADLVNSGVIKTKPSK